MPKTIYLVEYEEQNHMYSKIAGAYSSLEDADKCIEYISANEDKLFKGWGILNLDVTEVTVQDQFNPSNVNIDDGIE